MVRTRVHFFSIYYVADQKEDTCLPEKQIDFYLQMNPGAVHFSVNDPGFFPERAELSNNVNSASVEKIGKKSVIHKEWEKTSLM